MAAALSAACVECGRVRELASNPGNLCFRCKLDAFTGFTFRGVHRWGRRNFHDGSVAEFDREIKEGAKANGIEIDRAPSSG